MADYWKSLGRHYCDVCKCWFGDNKASIEFHEGGKRHQRNVEKQLRDARLKTAKDDKDKLEMEATLQQIEQAALSAYLKDVDGKTTEASVKQIAAAQSKQSLPTAPAADPELQKAAAQLQKIREKQEIAQKAAHFLKKKNEAGNDVIAPAAPPPPPPVPTSLWPWQQTYTPEGYIYYYNTQTGVTQWEPPNTATNPPAPPPSSSSVSQGKVKRREEEEEEEGAERPPPAKRRSNPYGSWTVTKTYARDEEEEEKIEPSGETGMAAVGEEQDGSSSEEEEEEGGARGRKKNRQTGPRFAEKTLGSGGLAAAVGEEQEEEGSSKEQAGFKGFSFKKRAGPRSQNIKQRTSDW